jgi:protein TonB
MNIAEQLMKKLVSPRIVDLVFAAEPAGRRRRLMLGMLAVVALYGGALSLLSRLGRSAGAWSAEMAARVHDAIAAERAVDVTPPPPPDQPKPEPPAAEARRIVRSTRALVRARAATPTAHPGPAAPAQAGQLAAAAPDPLDFTGSAFIVGSGATYAGGATTSTGTSRAPVSGTVAPGGTGDGSALPARSKARSVTLDQAAWNCPWPAEADAQQVDQQTVVLRAAVRPDGRAERVEVVLDPGFGFGPAARQCALATRFEPARDVGGKPIAALSPPIRVHFFR